MKPQLGILISLVISLLVACYPLKQTSQSQPFGTPNQFKGKYADFIPSDELVIGEWYHYVMTQDAYGTFVKRTFFPETKTLTSEIRFAEESEASKEGLASYWYDDGTMDKQGHYAGDIEHGLWNYYNRKSGELSRSGEYDFSNKIGIWKNYDTEGRLTKETTYVAGKREGSFIAYDTLQQVINEGIYKSDTIYQQTNPPESREKIESGQKGEVFKVVEQMPLFKHPECDNIGNNKERSMCSQGQMLRYIYSRLRYPTDAREYGVEGMTITQFVVDTTGNITEIETIRGVCQSMKDASESVIRLMPKWEPGMQRGEKVKVTYTLPIRYKLEG